MVDANSYSLPKSYQLMEDGEEGEVERKPKEKKKGRWRNIGHEPVSYELHPCLHRWQQKHPRGPCIQYKQIRWILLPLSDRLKQLAMPLLRRLLALWLEFGDKLPPEMRARLLKFMVDNYGLSEEFLEQILAEAIKAREEKGKKKKKKKKRKRRRRKKKKKGKKAPKEKTKPKGDSGLLFKRRKAGKLPLDWSYKIGCKFLLACISSLSKDPDEDYNSRASEYFDVQAMAILEVLCQNLDMDLPDPERPTQYGEAIVIMALNLSNWIAKYVTTPAQAIPDDKVDEYLDLRGTKPKKEKPKKEKPKKEKPGKGKKKVEEPEPVTEVRRNWEEHKSPFYIPEKSRVSRRKYPDDLEEQQDDADKILEKEIEQLKQSLQWEDPTVEEIKKDFLEYINWYNPWEPEFIYFGPRDTPVGVEMFHIYGDESNECPDDVRVFNWNQLEYGFTDNYSFIPSPVPQYYPCLRPLRPLRFEDLEKSGVPREIMKKNLRFYSPWYLMRVPLRPPPPTPPPTPPPLPPEIIPDDGFVDEFGGEYEMAAPIPTDQMLLEEVIEDEMLETEKEPPIKDSLWGDFVMREQLDILSHLLHLMTSIPDLTLEYVFELLEEFCEAVECAELDENSTNENKLLLKKRTIILEQYFLAFFGKKFRDYNKRTPFYMRVLCTRVAYYIQLLYEYTARILWELQSRANPPTPIPTRPETPDDPEALRDWDEWLTWLMKVTKTCDEWAGWISDTVNEAEKKAAKKKNEYIGPDGRKKPLTAEEWFSWKSQVEQKVYEYGWSKKQYYKESPYYMEKSKHILSVRHRQKVCPWEIYGESGEGGEYGEGEERKINEDSNAETEWEDVGEAEEEEEDEKAEQGGE